MKDFVAMTQSEPEGPRTTTPVVSNPPTTPVVAEINRQADDVISVRQLKGHSTESVGAIELEEDDDEHHGGAVVEE